MTRHGFPRSPEPAARAGWLRCSAVWLLCGVAAGGLAWWLLTGLAVPGRGSGAFEGLLVDGAAVAGAGCVLWLWLITGLTALDAARGQAGRARRGVPIGVRRVVLAACGLALAGGGLAGPAYAHDVHPGGPADLSTADVLAGLVLPDRPSTLAQIGLTVEAAGATTADDEPHVGPPGSPGGRARHADDHASHVAVVGAGDTLWSIAARGLPPGARPAQIAAAWQRLYQVNREVIGDDPDLIRPGQRLRVPTGSGHEE